MTPDRRAGLRSQSPFGRAGLLQSHCHRATVQQSLVSPDQGFIPSKLDCAVELPVRLHPAFEGGRHCLKLGECSGKVIDDLTGDYLWSGQVVEVLE